MPTIPLPFSGPVLISLAIALSGMLAAIGFWSRVTQPAEGDLSSGLVRGALRWFDWVGRSEEHTSELQSH